jgi:hypothetical protein
MNAVARAHLLHPAVGKGVDNVDKFIEIETKFDSSCFVCRATLNKGDKVWWRKGDRVRCDECTPSEERRIMRSFVERRDSDARSRASAFVNLFPWKYRDQDGEATELLEELKQARSYDEIEELIDRIVAIAEPINRRTASA